MRSLIGVLGLLIALAVVGLMAKQQLASTRKIVPALNAPADAAVSTDGAGKPQPQADTVKTQSQQIQQQYTQALEQAMQKPRVDPDEK